MIVRRNFDQPILNLNDEPITSPEGNKSTLAIVAINALLATFEDERGLLGKDKVERMHLALAINRHPQEVDLTTEQLAKIKELIGKAFPPLIVGRAYELLEQEPQLVAKESPS